MIREEYPFESGLSNIDWYACHGTHRGITMNFSIVSYILGWILRFEAAFLLLPTLVGVCYGEWRACGCYLASALACFLFGMLLGKKPNSYQLYAREGFVSVALGWIVISLMGAVPFVLTGDIPNYIDALFETISGFTTTGASILGNVEGLTYSSLFWRSFTHWIGGMGVFVFIMAILPMMGGSTMNLMRAESPGPSVSKLVPRVRDTAKILYEIYLAITVAEILLLCISGMKLFDSMTITFGTVGTGGFGVRNDSLASYSPLIQVIVTVFMILSGINYTFYYCLLMRHFKDAFSIEEVRWYLAIILGAAAIVIMDISSLYDTFGEAVRHAFFQVGSIITTTGFSTADFNAWPQLSKTVLVLLMFIGACAGSTGGGFKVSRILLLFKNIGRELSTMIHPRLVKKIKMDQRNVPQEVMQSANVFAAVYFVIVFVSLLLIGVDELDFTTNFTAVAATLNNIGPGLELVGPTSNFAVYSSFSKLVLMFDMLAGRLELFPMLILLVPSCWKKY